MSDDEESLRFSRLGACIGRAVSAASPEEGKPVLIITHHAIKTPGAVGGKTPQILDVDNQRATAASFTLWLLYHGKRNSVAYWN